MSLPEHDDKTREVLRKAGMSEYSELTDVERRRMPAAARTLEKYPQISRDRLYRIIRPREEEQ